ncbi:hypothetical protein FVEN_g9340 [Fusarium venenatum]|uniref:Uncharacterized protein n=1 Tax=Fusarium venenatum TaxID=56646 RepID=A0A2L2TPZ7_9HYPO|nr:uncharacterized protein FVRRES_06011 [Fusarium venenatum]KAG8352564.1 hypothetical protein FVEN_g9340 [Fusarium venenatum]KAH6993036.1 hypothetical protein EDB82DRAFT_545302 [Fusarium venenatum]CEI61575.1 unnamed protein product [Fusarium venenatum]
MSRFSPQLSGTHALVTGGSKGIGRVIVQTLLNEGANVSYCSRKVRGDEFADFKGANGDVLAVGTSVDIADATALKNWVENSAQKFGRVDLVVACACPMLFEPTIEHWEKSFQADILGLINLINTSAPHLEKQKGSIVVISSIAGFETKHPAIRGPYSTMKRAQATLAKDFGRWLAPRGVRINTIVPGAIDPPPVLQPDGTLEPSTFRQALDADPAWFEELVKSIPLGVVGQGQDIANAVVFLGSRLSKFTSGTNLIVDGGMSATL